MLRTRLRVLEDADLPAAMELLLQSPVENLFVTARISAAGLDPHRLGCEVWGLERSGRLVSLCHAGANLVPVNADQTAIAAFVERAGRTRRAASIMGNSQQALGLWEALSQRWGPSWSRVREVRAHQPLMSISKEPAIEGDKRVRVITEDDFEPYFDAAVKMYTEEVGVSPVDSTGSYSRYVHSLIQQRRAFGIVQDGRVVYKSDVGSASQLFCQVQGVWLDPEFRGRGLSAAPMAEVVNLCREHWPVVSLYVNDFNVRARRLYESVGFSTIGELATVLY